MSLSSVVSTRSSSVEDGQIPKRPRSGWTSSILAGMDTMSSLEAFFPFDGTCECSKDSDFTLTFEDESFLKVSKCLLEMASPVFKTAIGECDHDGILHLADTSKDAWILILNYIHPGGRADSYAENVVSEELSTLIDVLRQCRKYGFASLQQDLDRRIGSQFYAWSHTILSERKHITVVREPETYLVIDSSLIPFRAVRLFDLPQSEDAMASYLISVMEENNLRISGQQKLNITMDRRKIREATSRISDLVRQMRAYGRYRMCSLILQKMMDAQLCISLDTMNVGGSDSHLTRHPRPVSYGLNL